MKTGNGRMETRIFARASGMPQPMEVARCVKLERVSSVLSALPPEWEVAWYSTPRVAVAARAMAAGGGR